MDKPFAILGRFDTTAELYHACEKLRDQGFQKFDAHTPFPVHGLEKAMGLKPSKLPWIVLVCGLLGGTGGFMLQTWTHIWGYPQNISGKPLFAFPAYVPITFELTVLLAAFGTFFGMWALNRLPQLFHPILQHPTFHQFSDDKFFVSIEATDPQYGLARRFLEELGAKDIAEVGQ